jgi:hypothetical protein
MQGVPSSLGGDKRRCDMQRQLHGTGFVLREQMDRALLSQVSSQLSLPGALRRRCAPSALRRSWAPTLDHCTLFFYVQFHRLPSLRSSFVALDVVTERHTHTHTDVPNHAHGPPLCRPGTVLYDTVSTPHPTLMPTGCDSAGCAL